MNSYGNSDEATLTEPGLRRDAQAALEWCRARSDIDPKYSFRCPHNRLSSII
jgi:hypothetical protein